MPKKSTRRAGASKRSASAKVGQVTRAPENGIDILRSAAFTLLDDATRNPDMDNEQFNRRYKAIGAVTRGENLRQRQEQLGINTVRILHRVELLDEARRVARKRLPA